MSRKESNMRSPVDKNENRSHKVSTFFRKCEKSFRLLVDFVMGYSWSRKWRSLLASLPAVLVAGTALVFLLYVRKASPVKWMPAYNEAATAAMARGDLPAADVYLRRVAAMDNSNAVIKRRALLAEKEQNFELARTLMRQIAPENGAGDAEAHIWLAKDVIKRATPLTPQEATTLEHDLEKAALGTDNTEAHVLLGRFYASRGDAKRALLHVDQAVQVLPELRLTKAVLHAAQKDTAAARTEATRARDFFREKVETVAAAPPEYRVLWARAEVLLGNHATAVRILQPGLTSAEPKQFREALVFVYLSWYDAETEDGKRLDLLNAALAYGPNNPRALTLLAELSSREWERAGDARAALQKALSQGSAPATVHCILGTRALQKGDVEQAKLHLELAYQTNPQLPIVLNNLACMIVRSEKPDLPRALQLAEAARGLSNNPEITDTIGSILARMGKRREAVKELEVALRAFPNRARLHKQLAELYEQLGDAELAKLHRGLAEKGPETTGKP